ncbi:type II toxin-antitoxin system prevent-host-death family antitoxin [Sinorhizobium numidicum]|uniref:Antitoxin n=1 Tax=Sinorhizobium numidicum TaxID=680248 RepID=A0ABY8CPQ2_9HYPH|nr:type II toxin-antitoxin system prevent-host-death family antitoxin [Sinorhizobium numidicum]WEX74640.1 type II toxin-antitoxin system prevent-host-death family antitoxin [Sinorhizobium numidicum]WEX80631.1 type II toxin-antitoxin system prevent-host-death family antitoxin [Sinorhizobium numidicum]
MTTKTVSTVEFIRHFGRYHDEAMREPITLTKHGRASVVVVPVDLFERITKGADPRRVYRTSETPQELSDMILSELDKRLARVSDEPQND